MLMPSSAGNHPEGTESESSGINWNYFSKYHLAVNIQTVHQIETKSQNLKKKPKNLNG